MLMLLEVLLPFQRFVDCRDVCRIVGEAPNGSFGLLPHRLDFTTALVPGILVYETPADGERYLAVDAGVLVKTGPKVRVSVRQAVSGTNLSELRELVVREYLALDEQERNVRQVLAKLETGFLRRLGAFRHVQ